LFTALKPYIIAIPLASSDTWSINVNSVEMPVLLTLSPNINGQQAAAISECIKEQGFFASMDEFNQNCLAPNKIDSLDGTALTTQYFVVIARADLGSQKVLLT